MVIISALELTTRVEAHLGDPAGRAQWGVDPLGVLESYGLALHGIDEEQRSAFAARLAAPAWLSRLPSRREIQCKACVAATAAILNGGEPALACAVMQELVKALGGGPHADEKALAGAEALDGAGVTTMAALLELAEDVAIDDSAKVLDLPGEDLALACVHAFVQLSRSMRRHWIRSYEGGAVTESYIGYLSDEICGAKGTCG